MPENSKEKTLGYRRIFNCSVICRFVFCLLFSTLDVNVLIAYFTSVGGLHDTNDLICMCGGAFRSIHFSACFINSSTAFVFHET